MSQSLGLSLDSAIKKKSKKLNTVFSLVFVLCSFFMIFFLTKTFILKPSSDFTVVSSYDSRQEKDFFLHHKKAFIYFSVNDKYIVNSKNLDELNISFSVKLKTKDHHRDGNHWKKHHLKLEHCMFYSTKLAKNFSGLCLKDNINFINNYLGNPESFLQNKS